MFPLCHPPFVFSPLSSWHRAEKRESLPCFFMYAVETWDKSCLTEQWDVLLHIEDELCTDGAHLSPSKLRGKYGNAVVWRRCCAMGAAA